MIAKLKGLYLLAKTAKFLNLAFKIKNEEKEVFHNVLFDTGSDKLTPESYPVIETLAKYLKLNSDNKYLIVGHTDNTGNLKANQEL